MINLKLKSDIDTFKEDLGNLLVLLKTKSHCRSNEVDGLIKQLFERHFLNPDVFLKNDYHSFKNSTVAGIWFQGMVETFDEKQRQEDLDVSKKIDFLDHFSSLASLVNLFIGQRSKYSNRSGFSNLAYYFLLKLTALEPERFFPFDWILFAEGIEIGDKLKDDLRKFLLEKELIEYDSHFDIRISFKGRLFIEEKELNHG